ncbi:MAG: DUF1365 domain-containing protein [Rickettsiales bacterium]|nr:DUF1365 domain-containing protein [Rickettsiales bacterium]
MAIKTAIEKSAFFCPAYVMHKRLKPTINQFTYRVFYLCFDIAKKSQIASKFLSLNRFNLFSFYDKNYGKRDGSNLENWIREILREKKLDQKIQRIFLLTFPKILGYVFAPVSFWFCLDEKENLVAVLAEVNNTFGENHNYLIFNQDQSPIQENQWFEANKEFHVSPFFYVQGTYKFRFIFNQKNIAVWIDYLDQKNEKALITSLICRRENFCDLALIKAFFNIPFMTLKVIFLIHWQALKLFLKKNKYITKPKKLAHNITFNHEFNQDNSRN